MKWTLIIANVVTAVALVFLGSMAFAAHRAHATSVYRELQVQRVLVERPDFNVEQRLSGIAAGGRYSYWLGWVGAAACLVNAVGVGLLLRARGTGQ